MYFNFDDEHPDIPRVASSLSRRTAIIVSLSMHVAFFLTLLGITVTKAVEPVPVVPVQQQPIVFVDINPLIDRTATPKPNAPDSDLDRRSQTIEKAPVPENPLPKARGNSPEEIQTPPDERAAGPETPQPQEQQPQQSSPANPSASLGLTAATPTPPAKSMAQSGMLGQSLRNLQRYLQNQNFDNEKGGDTEAGADIQYDSKGVDFGPWLERFKRQIYANWTIPLAAETLKGHVVVQFVVLRDGTIIGLHVVEPSSIDSFTTAATTALKLSNPTAELPPEYPSDRIQFTVTFHYNEPGHY